MEVLEPVACGAWVGCKVLVVGAGVVDGLGLDGGLGLEGGLGLDGCGVGQATKGHVSDSTKGWHSPPRERMRVADPQLAVQAVHCCQVPQLAVPAPLLAATVVAAAVVVGEGATGQAPRLQALVSVLAEGHDPVRDLDRVPAPHVVEQPVHWPQSVQAAGHAAVLHASDSVKDVHPPSRDLDLVPPPQVTGQAAH